MKHTPDTLADLFDRGLIIESPDFRIETLLDKRQRIHLARELKPQASPPPTTETCHCEDFGESSQMSALRAGPIQIIAPYTDGDRDSYESIWCLRALNYAYTGGTFSARLAYRVIGPDLTRTCTPADSYAATSWWYTPDDAALSAMLAHMATPPGGSDFNITFYFACTRTRVNHRGAGVNDFLLSSDITKSGIYLLGICYKPTS